MARTQASDGMTQRQRLEAVRHGWMKAYRHLAPKSLPIYLRYINKGYKCKWFHYKIAELCQQLYEGKTKKNRLMVFVPPQHGKTEIISRSFPAWALGNNPDLRIVCCSYASTIAENFSRDVQAQIDSERYRAIFKDTCLVGSTDKQKARTDVRNVDFFTVLGYKGYYKAVGVDGALTSISCDIAIIDDPVKDRNEAYSETYRDRAWNWYVNVLNTRLHNNSKVLLVMTRWHEDDLAGRILEKESEEWGVIKIPAVCEVEDDGDLHSGRHVGEALWEEQHSLESILKQRANSERTFCALYQQRPTIEGGNIVRREWFKFISYKDFEQLHDKEPIHFYLDTAYEKRDKKRDNDPSGIIAVCYINGDLYILNAHRVWMDMPELLRFLPEYVERHAGRFEGTLYVEPKANGISVIQMLQRNTRLKVHRTQSPKDSKETRLSVASFSIEAGRVFLVRGEWNEGFIDEVCGFPSRPHDEYCDILGYAVKGMDDPRNKGIDYSKIGRMSFT